MYKLNTRVCQLPFRPDKEVFSGICGDIISSSTTTGNPEMGNAAQQFPLENLATKGELQLIHGLGQGESWHPELYSNWGASEIRKLIHGPGQRL